MAYLKALGVLRLVCEQKDPEARGWWKNDVFWLRSPVLFEDTATEDGLGAANGALMEFFLNEYKPTPLVAPWNAGSGFYLKWDVKNRAFKEREVSKAASDIESSSAERFRPYRDQIAAIKSALKTRAKPVNLQELIDELITEGKGEGWSQNRTKSEITQRLGGLMLFSADGTTFAIEKVDKDELVRDTRSSLLDDASLRWIDAAFVIRTGQKKNRTEAPLLGSGGNIGNSDFSARFMQILTSYLPCNDGDVPNDECAALLNAALVGDPTGGLATLAVDQFDPGRAGGTNMYQGMEAGSRLNPWDYILMLEGAVVFQSAPTKRLGVVVFESAFPFAVDGTPGAFPSSGRDATRGEQWLPLWNRASTAQEIETLLAEGRSEVGRRRARTGVEFARAAASLGVDRGISQFVRIQYQKRFGDNYLASALGRVDTLPRESVNLLRQIDPWLDDFRSKCAQGREKEEAPKRILSTLNDIDVATFEFCKYGGSRLFQEIVVALGEAERELALTRGRFKKKIVDPIPPLSPAWIEAADDGSVEFAVALAVASVYDAEGKIGAFRTNLEPVDWNKRCRTWAEKDRAVVWSTTDLATNLTNVLQRRMMDGARTGCERLPLASRFVARMDTVSGFLAGEIDDQRVEDLIWGLMLIGRGDRIERSPDRRRADDVSVPRAYALLKLLFLSRPLVIERGTDGTAAQLLRGNEPGGTLIRPEPSILNLLRGGRLGEACAIAMRRLRASGLDPMPRPIRARGARDRDWRELDRMGGAGTDPRRLVAALLIPISDDAANRLVRLVIRGDESEDEQTKTAAATNGGGGTLP